MILGILQNLCPNCEEGKVFSGILKMHRICPNCSVVFEPESGYFAGAMSLSYSIGFFLVLPTFLYLFLNEYNFWLMFAACSLQIMIQGPILFRYSRLSWLYIDHRMHPLQKEKQ